MKRQRPVKSCLPCRKRRVRCDKARAAIHESLVSNTLISVTQTHPVCNRCTKAGTSCGYYSNASEASAGNSHIISPQALPGEDADFSPSPEGGSPAPPPKGTCICLNENSKAASCAPANTKDAIQIGYIGKAKMLANFTSSPEDVQHTWAQRTGRP